MRPRRATTTVLRAVLACLLVAVACGCELRADLAVTLARDGAGDLTVSLGADPELQRRAREEGVDPLAALATAAEDLADAGWRVTQSDRPDGGREVAVAVSFDGPEELERLTTELADALSGPELRPLEPFRVALDDDVLSLAGGAALQPGDGVRELGLEPAEAVAAMRDATAVVFTVRASMPGEVLTATSDERDATQVTWRVRPGERVRIEATSERPHRGLFTAVAAAVLGASFAGVALATLRRRSAPRRWRRRSKRASRVAPDVAARYRR